MQQNYGKKYFDPSYLEELCRYIRQLHTHPVVRSITPDEVEKAYGWLLKREQQCLDALGAKCSRFLLHQLVLHTLDNYFGLIPPVFCYLLGGQKRPYNTHCILDEIRLLEWDALEVNTPYEARPIGLQLPRAPKTNSKPASMFRGKHLQGFWHKHHFQAGFISFNLAKFWQSRSGERQLDHFFALNHPGDRCSEQEWDMFLKLLSHKMTIGAYESRTAKHYLTGDWIIFAKHEGKNYYLFLAIHDDGDEQILECISRLRKEFPFLDLYPQFT